MVISLKKAALAFWYEYKYDLLRQFRYKFSFLTNALVYILLYCFIVFANKSTGLTFYYAVNQTYDRILLLIGYTYWQFSSYALGISNSIIQEESASGMLEAKLLSRSSVTLLLFSRLISSMVVCIVAQLFVVIVSILLGIMETSYFSKYCIDLVVYTPSIFGMFGMGLLFGGATLIYKNIGQFIFLIQTGLLLITNVFGMQSQIPHYMIPYSIGMDIARRLFLDITVMPGEWLYYFFLNIIWLMIGVKVFGLLLKKNKKYGYFNAY
jgi:ABC-2 type transport system permease protein